MSLTAPASMAARFRALRGEVHAQLRPVLREECARWLFVLRAALGAFLALWVSMLLHLDKPSTAMVCVVIVMQPRRGAVLARSIYRMLGNLAGGFMAVLLFSLFEQQPGFIIAGLGLWVLFCTAGAAKQRDAQSYGFVLAGYTACIVALPQLSAPESIFITATLRISEMMVGIICATLVSELVFPETVSNLLYAAAKKRFELFDEFVRKVLTGRSSQDEVEPMQLRFISDVAALDSHGMAASMEAGGGVRKSRVRLFNSWFMSASTSFHAFYAFMQDILPLATPAAQDNIEAMRERVAKTLERVGDSEETPESARRTAAAVDACREEVGKILLQRAVDPNTTRRDSYVLRTAAHVLRRFLTDFRAYLLQYADLDSPVGKMPFGPAKFVSNIDRSIPLISGLRAALLLFLLTFFWWGAAISDANGGTMVGIAVAFCALRAADPDPVRTIVFLCFGAVAGVFMGNLYSFLVLPQITGLPPLLASYFPFLAIGLYCCTIPSLAGAGRFYCIALTTFSGISPLFSVDAADLVSRSMAEIMGIGSAGVLHLLFFPVGGRWWQSRLRKTLLREASEACRARLSTAEHIFESGIRDTLLQFTANAFPSKEAKRDMLKQTLAVSELGRLVIELREYIASGSSSAMEAQVATSVLDKLRAFLKHPSPGLYSEVLEGMRTAIEGLAAAEGLQHKDPATGYSHPGEAEMLLRILRKIFTLTVEGLALFGASTPAASGGAGKEAGHAA